MTATTPFTGTLASSSLSEPATTTGANPFEVVGFARCLNRLALSIIVWAGVVPSFAGSAEGQPNLPIQLSEKHPFFIETLATGLKHPWGLEELPDGMILISEREGWIRYVRDNRFNPEDHIGGVPGSVYEGHAGLFDIRVHPRFKENRWLYLAYAKPGGNGSMTSVVRGKLIGNQLHRLQTVFEAKERENSPSPYAFGGRLAFDAKHFLYLTIGDRSNELPIPTVSQDLSDSRGKVHRLRDDGSIPRDNPFVGRSGALDSIWSYGHRNPQGLAFESGSGRLWSTEHGPRGGDELNIIQRGGNYGWPEVSHGVGYDGIPFTDAKTRAGMVDPVTTWTPSPGVSGLMVYEGSAFPKWNGSLFVCCLVGNQLLRLELEGSKVVRQEVLLGGTGRLRTIRTLRDGLIYLLYDDTRHEGGKLVRLVPAQRSGHQ